MENFGKWVFLIVFVGLGPMFAQFLEAQGWSREQTVLMYVAIGVVLVSSVYIERLKALEKWVGKTEFSDSKKWYRKLRARKPIEPVHGSITRPADLHTDEKPLLDFADTFAERVNGWLAYERHGLHGSNWRLQRTGKWDRYGGDYGGQYEPGGVNYKIWFNDQSFGDLRLSGYSEVSASIRIRSARVFSLESISYLVGWIGSEMHCSDEQLEKARQEMMFSALSALWQVGPEETHNPDLVFRLVGTFRDQRSVTEPEA